MSQTPALNHNLLRFLKTQDRPVLPTEIEDELGLAHGDLISELERLADIGYEVELHPYLGVRLLDIPDSLLVHEISESLNTKVIGKKIHVFESCSSTSDELWRLIEAGQAKDGDVTIANHQIKGRGRMGRSWESAKDKGIYLSFMAKFKLPQNKATMVTCATSLALANTIEQFVHLPAAIKWPNDVYIGTKKVAGILVEARSDHPDTFVVGIGINVNQTDFPEHLAELATSLRIERKSGPVHRIRLLRPLLFYLDNIFTQLRKKKFERIVKAWKEFVPWIGSDVTLRISGEDKSGLLVDLDPLEGIKLRDSSGNEESFRAEHVSTMSLS